MILWGEKVVFSFNIVLIEIELQVELALLTNIISTTAIFTSIYLP